MDADNPESFFRYPHPALFGFQWKPVCQKHPQSPAPLWLVAMKIITCWRTVNVHFSVQSNRFYLGLGYFLLHTHVNYCLVLRLSWQQKGKNHQDYFIIEDLKNPYLQNFFHRLCELDFWLSYAFFRLFCHYNHPSLPLPQVYRNKKFLILQGFPCFFYVSLI